MNTFVDLWNLFPRLTGFKLLPFIFLAAFLSFSPLPNAYSAQVTLAWDANSERDLAGYKIYYGPASRAYQFSVDVGSKTTCTISSLQDGSTNYFAVTAYDTSGKESTFSNEVTFQFQAGIAPAGTSPPGIASLVSPSGAISNPTPTYTWNAVPGSTWYFLWVDDSTGNKIQQWFSAEEAGCPTGTGTCSVTPTIKLAAGADAWWIQTWNALGLGPWSARMNFTVAPQPTGQATLVSPFGTITNAIPTYIWNAVPGSTWYFLWVDDSTGIRVQQWFSAEEAGCPTGTGTCSVTPTIELAAGADAWWIQTWNALGLGPWSARMNFTVAPQPPGQATLVSPFGTITNAIPTYIWNAVPGSTWYFLWVDDSTGIRVQQWFSAEEAGCPTGTGTCSGTPTIKLAPGGGVWWLQTWNNVGFGPWSRGIGFTIW